MLNDRYYFFAMHKKVLGKLLSFLAVSLPLLWRVKVVEPNLDGFVLVIQEGNGVAIGDIDHFAREVSKGNGGEQTEQHDERGVHAVFAVLGEKCWGLKSQTI